LSAGLYPDRWGALPDPLALAGLSGKGVKWNGKKERSKRRGGKERKGKGRGVGRLNP